MLSEDDFPAFFDEVHGCDPFPWQVNLVKEISSRGTWPAVLDLPTGAGKTAAIDIAVFHLALEANRREARHAPIRIAFVVDRRLIVDDAYARATRICTALQSAHPDTVAGRVAARLKELSGDAPPLLARRLRGGIPREDDWARTPSQPTVLCSTVDQVASRLLFRGYGVSDSMRPVHAGLIGSDCLILLDEAHLAEPFRQTLYSIATYRGDRWRQVDQSAPWAVSLLTATPGGQSKAAFSLSDADRSHPVLKKRLDASKLVRLVAPKKETKSKQDLESDLIQAGGQDELEYRVNMAVKEVRRALAHFSNESNGVRSPAIGVVLNRVLRARRAFERLLAELKTEIELGLVAEPVLMIGPARPVDRNALAATLDPIRTRAWKDGDKRSLRKALILVATQCLEAGVDIDLDALITEAAPLDALRQRFGRLNRAGRAIVPYGAVIAARCDLRSNQSDPVYGHATRFAWESLVDIAATRGRGGDKEIIVDFGLNSFWVQSRAEALSPRADAPVLLPAHVDLLSHTAPIPAIGPDVALFLRGTERQSDSVSVVWRADMDPETQSSDEARRLLKLVPPRALESIELPLWAVIRWLEGARSSAEDVLADVATGVPPDEDRERHRQHRRRVFRWKGDDARSQWVEPAALRVGDAVVVPAAYGGVDTYGWNPSFEGVSTDIGREAAEGFAGRRLAVRVAPGLLGDAVSDDALADALAGTESQRWQELRQSVASLPLPAETQRDLAALDDANGGRVVCCQDVYGTDDEGRPRGIVFLAPLGIKKRTVEEDGGANTTEDDTSGSIPGFRLSLERHSADVAKKAAVFAELAGLGVGTVSDIELAGFLHDAGKADSRFQAWLHFDDPLGVDVDESVEVLAKSDRLLPRSARQTSGLPDKWRHEALSVRMALLTESLSRAHDPELVLWLIGTHHGFGRPFFPHSDDADAAPRALHSVRGLPNRLDAGSGPQSLGFDWMGKDWPTLFESLKARYGAWELARMEAILRLADHRASEEAARRAEEKAS